MDEKKLNLIGLIIKILIIAPALIAGFVVMGSGVNADSDPEVRSAFMDSLSFNAVINISFITIIAAVILVLAFFALLVGTRPMDAIRSIMGIIVAFIVFFILLSIGTSDTSESLNLGGGLSVEQGAVDFAHAGIITALLAITICGALALFLGYVLKLVRKI
jgi:uncharacterized membrane protein